MNDTMEEALAERPWLKPFLEDGDEDLEPAERRWSEAVREAKAELRRLGVVVHERARTRSGLETTALVLTIEGEGR